MKKKIIKVLGLLGWKFSKNFGLRDIFSFPSVKFGVFLAGGQFNVMVHKGTIIILLYVSCIIGVFMDFLLDKDAVKRRFSLT